MVGVEVHGMVGVVVVVVGVGDLKEPEEKVIQIIQLMVAEGEVPLPQPTTAITQTPGQVPETLLTIPPPPPLTL